MVNLDELRKKYEEVTQQNSGGNKDFLSKFLITKEGTSLVRILPAKNEDENFYAETAIHRLENDGQFRNYHCPRVKGNKCPLCDLYYALWKTDSDDNHNLARSIKARKRYYLNAVDRETGAVKILSIGMKLFGKILDCFFDDDYGDITDLKEGYDFKVVKDTNGQFPNYDKSAPKPRPSEAGSAAEVATWMDELHDIQNLVKVAEYDELKQMAMNYELAAEGMGGSTGGQAKSDDDYLSHLKNLDTNQ
jgi:hypothetical protein|tara:strand:+ start:450 stop:1193 length:744 start_codon:yes stop_codon:yes gene_type:complete